MPMLPQLLAVALVVSLATAAPSQAPTAQGEKVQWFTTAEVQQQAKPDQRWVPFLQPGTLSCGIYRLKAGAADDQTPHALDEVYHVLAGRARLEAGGDTRPVAAGSVVYVAAGVPHRFVEIEEDLSVLVFFSLHRATTGGMAVGPKPVGQTPYPETSQRGNARIFYWFGSDSAGQVSLDHGQPRWQPSYEKFLTQTGGKRWRLGENFWTSLDTNMALTMAGVEVPPGQYYMVLEHHAEHGLRLVLLDPQEIRKGRLDAFEAFKTTGGRALPVTSRKAESAAARLHMELLVDRSHADRATLRIHFGTFLLEVPVVMHPGPA